MTDHVNLRLYTGGLYLTNYVTSEGNWLHQILFRGFIAKGVNIYGAYIYIYAPLTTLFFKQVIFFQQF